MPDLGNNQQLRNVHPIDYNNPTLFGNGRYNETSRLVSVTTPSGTYYNTNPAGSAPNLVSSSSQATGQPVIVTQNGSSTTIIASPAYQAKLNKAVAEENALQQSRSQALQLAAGRANISNPAYFQMDNKGEQYLATSQLAAAKYQKAFEEQQQEYESYIQNKKQKEQYVETNNFPLVYNENYKHQLQKQYPSTKIQSYETLHPATTLINTPDVPQENGNDRSISINNSNNFMDTAISMGKEEMARSLGFVGRPATEFAGSSTSKLWSSGIKFNSEIKEKGYKQASLEYGLNLGNFFLSPIKGNAKLQGINPINTLYSDVPQFVKGKTTKDILRGKLEYTYNLTKDKDVQNALITDALIAGYANPSTKRISTIIGTGLGAYQIGYTLFIDPSIKNIAESTGVIGGGYIVNKATNLVIGGYELGKLSVPVEFRKEFGAYEVAKGALQGREFDLQNVGFGRFESLKGNLRAQNAIRRVLVESPDIVLGGTGAIETAGVKLVRHPQDLDLYTNEFSGGKLKGHVLERFTNEFDKTGVNYEVRGAAIFIEGKEALTFHSIENMLKPTLSTVQTPFQRVTELLSSGFVKKTPEGINVVNPKYVVFRKIYGGFEKSGKSFEQVYERLKSEGLSHAAARKGANVETYFGTFGRYSKDIPAGVKAMKVLINKELSRSDNHILFLKQYNQYRLGMAKEFLKPYEVKGKGERAVPEPNFYKGKTPSLGKGLEYIDFNELNFYGSKRGSVRINYPEFPKFDKYRPYGLMPSEFYDFTKGGGYSPNKSSSSHYPPFNDYSSRPEKYSAPSKYKISEPYNIISPYKIPPVEKYNNPISPYRPPSNYPKPNPIPSTKYYSFSPKEFKYQPPKVNTFIKKDFEFKHENKKRVVEEYKQPRKYTPSVYAVAFGIKAKRVGRLGVDTGLGVMPVLVRR